MKKIVIINLFLLISLMAFTQSHIFERVQESTDQGEGWGRWVTSVNDIGIKSEGDGYYKVEVYQYGASHPALSYKIKFNSKDGEWFVYKPEGREARSKITSIKSNIELSKMAVGFGGTINIFTMDGRTVGFSCSGV